MTQTLILLAAVSGSVLYLFDRIAALIKRGKETKEKRSEQLTEVLRLKDAKIEELQAKIRLLESSLRCVRRQRAEQIASSARLARPADPVDREAEAKADEAMAQARNIALAAIEASGREKSRLIAQARRLAERANEYRRVARGELLSIDQVQAQAQDLIGKIKQDSAVAAQFEVLGGE